MKALHAIRRFFVFVCSLYWPATDDNWIKARVAGFPDLAWQPFLFTAAFYGALLTPVYATAQDIPPGSDWGVIDIIWIVGSLTSPLFAIWALWIIRHCTGRMLYFGFWIRLSSGVGMATSLISYESQRLYFSGGADHPFEDAMILASIVFLLTMIYRDVKLLRMTEELALKLRCGGGDATC